MSKAVKRKVELQKPSSSKSRLSVFQRLGTKKSKSLVSVHAHKTQLLTSNCKRIEREKRMKFAFKRFQAAELSIKKILIF